MTEGAYIRMDIFFQFFPKIIVRPKNLSPAPNPKRVARTEKPNNNNSRITILKNMFLRTRGQFLFSKNKKKFKFKFHGKK